MRLILLAIFSLVSSAAYAQDATENRSQARTLLRNERVNMERAIVFTANRMTITHICQLPPVAQGIAEGISRFEYAALDEAEQAQYRVMIQQQAASNRALYDSGSASTREQFCEGASSYVRRYAFEFMQRHPHLFENRRQP